MLEKIADNNWQLQDTRIVFLKMWSVNQFYHKYLESFQKHRFLSPILVLEDGGQRPLLGKNKNKQTNKKIFSGEYLMF